MACRDALSIEDGAAVDLDEQFRLFDALLLDAESYYSTADRLFRLGGKLLPPDLAQRLRETPSVELIHRIRNRFVEHAYEDGDPAQGFGIRDDVGLTLKSASVFEGFGVDPGFEVNTASVDRTIEEFALDNLPPGDPPSNGLARLK